MLDLFELFPGPYWDYLKLFWWSDVDKYSYDLWAILYVCLLKQRDIDNETYVYLGM